MATKLQNRDEFVRWYRDERRPYSWIVGEYRRKYGVEIVPSTIGQWRHQLGLEPRTTRDDSLIPWAVRPEHRQNWTAKMLQTEAKRRAGKPISERYRKALESWLARLEEANAVVHYDPDTEDGWHFIPREPTDTDIIRRPAQVTRQRKVRV